MSEQQAYLRILVARLARRFPVVLEMLAAGEVNLSTLKVLSPHLTDRNHAVLLERARNKTKAEVELLVAEVAPKPDVPDRIRKLPERRSQNAVQAGMDGLFAAGARESVPVLAPTAAPAEAKPRASTAFALEAPRGSCRPLAPGRFELKMTASQSLRDKLQQLQHLLRHRVPRGDLAIITELAFDLLLEKTLKQRFAQVSKPRTSAAKTSAAAPSARDNAANHAMPTAKHPDVRAAEPIDANPIAGSAELWPRVAHRCSTKSRYVPSAVLREVFSRDGAQCTFEGPSGLRCDERGMVEVHHVHAFALGGQSTVENLKLVCRAHNQFFADQDFGSELMRRRRALSKTRCDQAILSAADV